MKKSYSYDAFLYGVAYYPEQWPKARWDTDLARIAQTGMNVVRMGDGAWSLNQAWGTIFWSQTYTSRHEVWLPRPTVTYQNPGLLLDFYRFTSDMTIRFAAMQGQIIKRIASHQFVTHNAFQTMKSVDLAKFVQESVDFISYDTYPQFKVCAFDFAAGLP
jgi:beta-galactosidase GanA